MKAVYIKDLLLRLCMFCCGLGVSEKGWGQTPNGYLDFGTTANGTTASITNTGLGGVRVGTGGGSFTIQNPGQSIGTAAELRGVAPTSGSINSIGITNAEYGTAAATFTISFELHLSGGASGTWYFFAGNGTSFGSSQSTGFTGSEVFTGIQWVYGASSAITTNNRATSSWSVISGTPFTQNTSYYVTIVGNNSSSTVNYGASSAYSVAAYKYDLWVNGSLAGDDLAKAQLANSTSINAFRFYGESSTSNVATIALDNIRWYNSCVLPPTHLSLVGVPSAGTVANNLSSFTAEARSGSATGPVANSFTGVISVAKVSGTGSISGTTSPNAIAGVATYNNIQFSAAATYTINASAAAPIADAATSGNIVISSATPSITLASSNPAVAASDLIPSATKQPVYKFTTAVTTANATLNSVAFSTTNTSASDITKYQLWYNSSDNLGTATQIGTDITTSLGSGTRTFSSLTQSISSGATGYFWITVDVASAPTAGNTLSVSAITTSDLTFASGTKSGTASAGGTQTFINTPGAPTLGTITAGNQQLSCAFTAGTTGGSSITNYEYSTDSGATWTARSPAATSSPIVITGLTNGSTYNVKIRAVNAAGSGTASSTVQGTPRTTPGAPNINTITPGNQQLQVAFTAPASNGGSAITDYEYSTDNGSTFKSSGVTSSPYTITTVSGSSSSLTNGTQYSIIFRAVNAAGAGASSTMVPGTPAAGCTAPSTQASSFGTSSVTDVTATVTWTRGSGDNVLVLMKSGSAVNSSPSSGTSYSANATFGSGSQIGTGNYVVYAGTGTSVAVTGLTTGITYHVAIIEYNNTGTCYSSGPLTGSFTTKSTPTVSTSAASGVGLTTATLNGNVTNDGGYSVSRGFVYSSINTNPTVGGANVTDVSVGTGTGTYTNGPTLSQNTTYYYQAYATNSLGTSYGGVQNFTTLKPEPTAHVTSFAIGTVTTSNIPLTWTAASPAPDGYLLLVNSSSVTDPTDGTAVSDDLDVSNGTGAINLSGSASSYSSFTGFAAGTTYTFKIYPYNNSGSNIDYLVTSAPSVNSLLLPAAPTTPTFSLVTQSSFTITWGAVTGASSYRLDLSDNSGFSSYISGYQDLTVNSTSQAVSGLSANTTYYTRVRAVNSAGASANTATANTTTYKSQPASHVTSFAIGTVTTSNIPLTWTAASPAPDGYLLLVNSSSVTDPTDGTAVSDDLDVSNGTGAINLSGSASSYSSFTGFAAGTTYTFKIYPYNNGGSNIDYLVTSAPSVNSLLLPAAPTTPTFSLVTQSSFTITWGAVTGASSYRLDLSDNSGFSSYISGYQDLTVNSTSQAVSGLSANTTYYTRVRAVNSAGTGANASANQTTLCTPTDVTSLAGTNGNTQSAVTFVLSACRDEILIVAKPSSSVSASPTGDGSAYTASATFGSGTSFDGTGRVVYKGTGTSVTVTGLTNGTTYYIKAFTREGSQWSSGTEVSVVPTIPVTLWSATSGATTWHTSGNWSPSTSPSAWLTDDVAQFQNSGIATTAGINMSNFSTSLSIGGIEMHGARTRALTIGNSSTTTTTGVLTLNGSMINFIPNVILRNNSNSLLTIQNNETGTGKTMNVALGNSTNNIIYIDSSGGISISSNISGSSRLLSLAGVGTGKLTLSGSNTFSGGVTINSGRSLNVNNNAALGTGTFTINGGIIDATVSGINITNAMQIGASFRYTGTQNLTQSTGNITLTTSPTITVDASVLSLGGVISGSFGITKAGSGTLTLTAGNLYSGITTVSAGTLRLNRTGGTTIPANNNVTVNGGTLQISTNQVLNDVNISGGTLQVDAGVTLTINGAYTGGGTIVNNGKIVITSASAFPGSSTTISAMNDLEINRSAGVALDKNMTVTGTLTLTSGILDLSSQTLTISGTVARTSGTIDADAGTLTFTNTTGRTLPSSLFSGNINNLTMNGSGGITLGNAATVTGTLTLTSGLLTTTSTNLLTLADGSTVSGVSNSSFIHGPIKKVGNTGFTFPVGASGTGYQPIQIANFSGTTASTDAFTAEYKRSSAAGVGTNINSPVNRVSYCEYWQLDRTNGTPAVDVTLHFNTNSGCGGGTPADYLVGNSGLLSELRVCRWDGTQWVNYTTSYTGTAPNVTLTATGVSSFSPFTVGSTGLAPLPLKLLSFKGIKSNESVHLNWVTLDETHMKSVILQSSTDGVNFEKVAEIPARNTPLNIYAFIDTSFAMRKTYRMQQNRYYRLEFIENDLSSEFSPWINVIDSEVAEHPTQFFDLYPNPANNQGITLFSRLTVNVSAELYLFDNTGRLVYRQNSNFDKRISLPTSMLRPGMYTLLIQLPDGRLERHKICKQP